MEAVNFRGNVCLAEIETHHESRPQAPDNVWDWQAYEIWRDVVWELLDGILTKGVYDDLTSNRPEYLISDDLSWLDDVILENTGQAIDSRSYLFGRLIERYESIRVVHGTRLNDLQSVCRDGLVPLSPVAMQKRAREIFLSGEFPELSEESLQEAFRHAHNETRYGRVFFEGNEKLLVSRCGHYMHYGSEYLNTIAANIPSNHDYRQILKKLGKPTVLLCDVPLRLIPSPTIKSFAGRVLEMVFEELLDGTPPNSVETRGAGLCIHEALPPQNIIGFYHPYDFPDPLTHYS